VKLPFNIKSGYQFIENTVSLFSIKAIDLGLTIWLIPYLIVKIGLDNYGMYAFAMALVIFFVNILNYGFSLATVRELAKNKENPTKINELFNEVISVKLVLFLLEYGFFMLLIVLFPTFWELKTLYFFTSLILVAELFSFRWFFLGMEQMKIAAIIKLISTLGYVLLVVLFIKQAPDFTYIPLFEAAAMILVGSITFLWVLKKYRFTLKFISLSAVFQYLKSNFNSFINLLVPSTFANSIVFLMGVLGLPAHVSYLQIALKISSAFSTVNNVLTLVFYPMVNRKEGMMLPSRVILISIGVLLSTLLFFGSSYLVSYWLTFENVNSYKQLSTLVQIVSTIPLLMAIISSYGINGLLAYYKDVLYSKITLVATFVMFLSAWILIPIYSYYGAAFSFVLGKTVYAVWSYIAFKKVSE
jgi:O-antigen/teichoic acid export membrane protein